MKQDEWSADQGRRGSREVADHEGDRLIERLVLDPVANDPAATISGRHLGLGEPMVTSFSRRRR